MKITRNGRRDLIESIKYYKHVYIEVAWVGAIAVLGIVFAFGLMLIFTD